MPAGTSPPSPPRVRSISTPRLMDLRDPTAAPKVWNRNPPTTSERPRAQMHAREPTTDLQNPMPASSVRLQELPALTGTKGSTQRLVIRGARDGVLQTTKPSHQTITPHGPPTTREKSVPPPLNRTYRREAETQPANYAASKRVPCRGGIDRRAGCQPPPNEESARQPSDPVNHRTRIQLRWLQETHDTSRV